MAQPQTKRAVLRSHEHAANARELQERVAEFTQKADSGEVRTLLRILRRWPEIKACSSRDALFASIVAEFRGVLEVENVPT